MSDSRTVFKRVDYDLSGLLHYIDVGDIALPDIQRPFLWPATKVRDLFDSMYRGFPVGYLLFWSNDAVDGSRQIGVGEKVHRLPQLLIVDGQQRLTSLYSVFRGKAVVDSEYRATRVEIGFRPRDGRFEVTDAAIRKDPEFIPNISEVWTSGKASYGLVKAFLDTLKARRPLNADEEETISHNLDRLFDLQKYPFTALEIAASVDEEQVADIFVRINSEGIKLNQADFILTLLSVFWDEGRAELEKFCRESRIPPHAGSKPSPYNHFIEPSPDQLIRVDVAVGFNRGRLRSVYQILRGRDPDTETVSVDRRQEQFAVLQEAQQKVLNLTYWHQFFGCLLGAGFRSGALISSENALLFAYSLYLIGKTRHAVPEHELQRLIGRWFYAAALSGRYTGSAETAMDADLSRVRNLTESQAFVETLQKIVSDTLTNDFWAITLPNDLESSSVRSPALFAYYAAQNKLGAPVLFSDKKVGDLLDPSLKLKKKSMDVHHLFPRAWLESSGVTDFKAINQVANFALLEWPDNIQISDEAPSVYVPQMRSHFGSSDWDRMCELHALPAGWEHLSYDEFLRQRRPLMAQIIRRGFEALGKS
ncbi:MAG: DUF262 domain-containing protein [Candidatus Dormibacteraeota bacterium]|nr:DUF262 domain-containing protein [Candidatus Dormibacteraeota bacterium]